MLAQSKAKGISIADYNDKNFEPVRAELQSISHDIAVHTKKVDVASSSQVDAWIDEVFMQFGGIDGAVNAAGVTQRFGTYTLEHCTPHSYRNLSGETILREQMVGPLPHLCSRDSSHSPSADLKEKS